MTLSGLVNYITDKDLLYNSKNRHPNLYFYYTKYGGITP